MRLLGARLMHAIQSDGKCAAAHEQKNGLVEFGKNAASSAFAQPLSLKLVFIPIVEKADAAAAAQQPIEAPTLPPYTPPPKRYNEKGELLSPFNDGSIQAEGAPYIGPLPECSMEFIQAMNEIMRTNAPTPTVDPRNIYGCAIPQQTPAP